MAYLLRLGPLALPTYRTWSSLSPCDRFRVVSPYGFKSTKYRLFSLQSPPSAMVSHDNWRVCVMVLLLYNSTRNDVSVDQTCRSSDTAESQPYTFFHQTPHTCVIRTGQLHFRARRRCVYIHTNIAGGREGGGTTTTTVFIGAVSSRRRVCTVCNVHLVVTVERGRVRSKSASVEGRTCFARDVTGTLGAKCKYTSMFCPPLSSSS